MKKGVKLVEVTTQLQKDKERLLQNNHHLLDEIERLKEKMERREHHHKYKRCLAMAMWCDSENYTACWYHESSERCKWTEKWHKRWLELAEKFKELKNAED